MTRWAVPLIATAAVFIGTLQSRVCAAIYQVTSVTIEVVIVDDLTPRPVPLTDFRLTELKRGAVAVTLRTDEAGRIKADLEPGSYVLESVRPASLKGRSFTWRKRFDVEAGFPLAIKLTDADAQVSSLAPAPSARKVSDEAAVYTQLKAGVVTVEADTGCGSGFLVDSSGLILTNQHVVRNSHWLAVRLVSGARVRAWLVAEDAAADVAVIRVNAAIVRSIVPLKLADPAAGPLAVEGEKVLAIGSPLHQVSALTTGIVSKVEQDVLISDVNLNPGNSGGPLLNLAGDVIGITTFIDSGRIGPGISGTVAISKALPILHRAATDVSGQAPEAKLLPDISKVPFPTGDLDDAARHDIEPVVLKAPHNYITELITPKVIASNQSAFERLMGAASKHRTGKLAASISGGEQSGIEPHRFWEKYAEDYRSAVVMIRVKPVLRESALSVWAGLFSAAAGVMPHKQMEFHSDFYDMELYRGDRLIEPVRRFCVPYRSLYLDYFVTAVDEAHAGIYEYDPSVFSPGARITIKVRDSSNLKSYETLVLSDDAVGKVLSDFESYRAQPGASTVASDL